MARIVSIQVGWPAVHGEPGAVEVAGEPTVLLDRPCPDWSIARAFGVMRTRSRRPAEAAQLAAVPALSAAWR